MEVDDIGGPGADVAEERPEDYEERLRMMMDTAASGDDDENDEGEGEKDGRFQLDVDPEDLEPYPDYDRKLEEVRKQLEAHPLSNPA